MARSSVPGARARAVAPCDRGHRRGVARDIIANIRRHASDPGDSDEAADALAELSVEVGPEQEPLEPPRMFIPTTGRLGPIARSGFAALTSTGAFHLGHVAAYLHDERVREGAIEATSSPRRGCASSSPRATRCANAPGGSATAT
ncbi:hypothetical protein ACFYZ3_28540 [Streptomyces sp. NPDC001599]|uniref:hypothetical protein n=1 Tax=Streptomyces sp. NPDC001599 TaxID=3364591 RepID=UPI0036C7D955